MLTLWHLETCGSLIHRCPVLTFSVNSKQAEIINQSNQSNLFKQLLLTSLILTISHDFHLVRMNSCTHTGLVQIWSAADSAKAILFVISLKYSCKYYTFKWVIPIFLLIFNYYLDLYYFFLSRWFPFCHQLWVNCLNLLFLFTVEVIKSRWSPSVERLFPHCICIWILASDSHVDCCDNIVCGCWKSADSGYCVLIPR